MEDMQLRQPQTRRKWLANFAMALVVPLAAELALPLTAEAASANAGCCGLRPQDQLWLVSDRSLGCASQCSEPKLQYWRYDCQQHWTRASLDELLAAEDPETNTVVYLQIGRAHV